MTPLDPASFERHKRGDNRRFHVRINRQPNGWDYEVYGYGLDVICVCANSERANMVADALEEIADGKS